MPYAPLVHQHRRVVTPGRNAPAGTAAAAVSIGIPSPCRAGDRAPSVWNRDVEIPALQRAAGNRAVQSFLRRADVSPPAGSKAAPGKCLFCGRCGRGTCACGRSFLPLVGSQGAVASPASSSGAPGIVRSAEGAGSSASVSSGGAAFPSASDWYGDPLLEAIRFSASGSNSALLANGASGTSVVLVQQALRAWGVASLVPPGDLLPKGGADGDYGSETASAVKVVQSRAGVDPDGMLGPITLGFLDSHISGGGGASEIDISADDHLVGPAVPGGQPNPDCPDGGIVDCSALEESNRHVLVTTRIATARGFVRKAIGDLPAP